jgi:hypothetical protein
MQYVMGRSGHSPVPVTEDMLTGASDYSSNTADGLIKTGPGTFYGCEVTAALSAAAVEIRDSLTAGGGTVIATIPASSAVGYQKEFGGRGIKFTTGLYIDFGGTGTVVTLYR